MSNPMIQLADLFDKLADEMERAPVEEPKTAAVPAATAAPAAPSKATKLSELVKSATGEDLPNDVAERIAKDDGLFAHVAKLAEHGARPTPMGAAVEKTGADAPMTKQAKLQSAWDRWNESVLNHR